MTKSYFKEPNGIFKTLAGFSMGDIAASRGSEVILRGPELEIFRKLKQKNLLKNIVIYLRFKNDIFVIVNGSNEEMTKSLEIIATGYPDDIQLNSEVNIIQGEFLNLRIYNVNGESKLFTTILRKQNCKYNIIRPNSNKNPLFKTFAAQTYLF